VPVVSALNKPAVEIVPTAVLLLLQVPPEVASVNEDVLPWQTAVVPPITAGKGFTVTGFTAKQPVVIV
jgi:hypothetical protein